MPSVPRFQMSRVVPLRSWPKAMWVALRVTAEGTHVGAGRGIKPSGKHSAGRGINLDGVAGGRMVEQWGAAETVGRRVQLGVNPFGSAQ